MILIFSAEEKFSLYKESAEETCAHFQMYSDSFQNK